MWKTIALVAVGLAGLGTVSAAEGDKRRILPGGCIPPRVEEFRGQLVKKLVPTGPNRRFPMPILDPRYGLQETLPYYPPRLVWALQVGKQTHELELGTGKDAATLQKKLEALLDKPVVVTGTRQGARIGVKDVRAEDKVELLGKLVKTVRIVEQAPKDRLGPSILLPSVRTIVRWSLAVEGKTYLLGFDRPEVLEGAWGLSGLTVRVKGRLSGNTIQVNALEIVFRSGTELGR
jgi:hypothetical protein